MRVPLLRLVDAAKEKTHKDSQHISKVVMSKCCKTHNSSQHVNSVAGDRNAGTHRALLL